MNIEQLYQEKILSLARSARQSTGLDDADYSATIKNPTCGDRVRVDLVIDKDRRITTAGAVTDGCALCEAATGLLLMVAPGQDADRLGGLTADIEAWLKGQTDATCLDDQDAFTPVRAFGSRHGCVLLPFQAAARAVADHSTD